MKKCIMQKKKKRNNIEQIFYIIIITTMWSSFKTANADGHYLHNSWNKYNESTPVIHLINNGIKTIANIPTYINEMEWPTIPNEFNAEAMEEFLTNPIAIVSLVLIVWGIFVFVAIKCSGNKKENTTTNNNNIEYNSNVNGDEDDSNNNNNSFSTPSNKREKDEFVRIFQSRIKALKESERQVDERIEHLEELLDENNGYQMWSNVLPVALSVIALIVSLRRGR